MRAGAGPPGTRVPATGAAPGAGWRRAARAADVEEVRVAGYAVVDLETTGLFPGGSDRIVEVAVVHVAPDGTPERSWSTLLNPGRDLGPQHIHGIVAADVLRAPTFEQVAGTLAGLLAGRAFVAHNASFDMRFVRAEFAALGFDVPVVPETSLCTLHWAGRLLPTAPRSLAGCCAHVGIPLVGQHAALVDATATAALLAHYLTVLGTPGGTDGVGRDDEWRRTVELAETATWPTVPVHDAACCHRGAAAAEAEQPFLSRIVERLPRTCGPAEHQEYLALLDRALLDRFISLRERDALVGFANGVGIDRATAVRLHRDYLAGLAHAAVRDGVVTEDEVMDLVGVAELLAVEKDEAMMAVEAACRGAGVACGDTDGPEDAPRPTPVARFTLHRGDRVVFTGDMDRPRDEWVRAASAAGLVPWPNVTRAVALVVAADPDSLSGKARRASAYGIPIVTEQAFGRMLERLDARP